MTDTDLLIQTLAAAQGGEDASLFLDNGDYLDWSVEYGDGARLEVGDSDDAAVVHLSRADVVTLQQRLTLWLLNNPA
ncbi:MAG TPA: hypothetical protein VHA75_20235 [Rugosimonospora sp.]|nr:hypothetical protein [Rugosimonospora sp.]